MIPLLILSKIILYVILISTGKYLFKFEKFNNNIKSHITYSKAQLQCVSMDQYELIFVVLCIFEAIYIQKEI